MEISVFPFKENKSITNAELAQRFGAKFGNGAVGYTVFNRMEGTAVGFGDNSVGAKGMYDIMLETMGGELGMAAKALAAGYDEPPLFIIQVGQELKHIPGLKVERVGGNRAERRRRKKSVI